MPEFLMVARMSVLLQFRTKADDAHEAIQEVLKKPNKEGSAHLLEQHYVGFEHFDIVKLEEISR
jgi:hypothetical protein